MGYRTWTCPVARECGGCEWLAVPYPIQLSRKRDAVAEALAAPLAREGAELLPIAGMGGDPVAFRNKAASPFAPGRGGRVRCGFYRRGTHRIVACDACLVEDERARPLISAVARAAERLRIPAYDEDRGTGVLRHAVVRSSRATGELMLVLVTNGDALPRGRRLVEAVLEACPEVTTVVQNVNERRTNAILGARCRTLHGPGTIRDVLLGCTFEIGPTSFYQTNHDQTEVLYRLAIEAARLGEGEAPRVLDAYCGTGTIGVCCAASCVGARVTGVERVAGAVACARRNAEANGVAGRCRFVAGDATRWMGGEGTREELDVVVLDPPRAGSTRAFLAGVVAAAPRRVVYVSCNPATLARDLVRLQDGGYRLETAQPVDMFPHTRHAEVVCALSAR